MKFQGVWLPIITPFKDDKVDYASYKKLIDYYIPTGITGIVTLGTTGESPTVSDEEYLEITEKTLEFVAGRVPVIVGLGGNYTKKVVSHLNQVGKYGLAGILSPTPYYNRPDQRGIYEHFKAMADSTALDIILYNIPYRSGRNIENETIYKLSEIKNITGLKDCSADMKQTTDFLLNPPKDFTVLTGEDALYYPTMLLGGHGGILASAHVRPDLFIDIYKKSLANDHKGALESWKQLYPIIPLLFKEPNPAPLKYLLYKAGLIDSPEVRLPLLEVTNDLASKLDRVKI